MKPLILLLLLAFGGDNNLSTVLSQTAKYDNEKLAEVTRLKADPARDYQHYARIYEAYQLFNYDSAYVYASLLKAMAHDSVQVADAQLKLCFILLSAGLFKETYDALSTIQLPSPAYYLLWGRYYYDLASYDSDVYHSLYYDVQGGHYMDSALQLLPENSFEFNYYSGLKYFKQQKLQEAIPFFEKINHPDLHQQALTASTLSALYLQLGDTGKAIQLLKTATIADVKSSTKETLASLHLATLLYHENDLSNALLCIRHAIANATFYGARQRKIQVSTILPLIEDSRVLVIKSYATIVSLLGLSLIILMVIVYQQNHALRTANEKLEEASRIKEGYITYFFTADADFYTRLDKIKHTITLKLQEKRYGDIPFYLDKIDARKERATLLGSFDKIFLALFPNFVAQVNALLREDEQIILKEGELLTTDLRILALMRMGITDPGKIASILEYSVKTIYSYKARVRNKAVHEGFEERVMRIK